MAWTAPSKNGKSWRGFYRDAAGKTHSIGTHDSKSVALEIASEAEAEARAGRLTYREWWAHWEPIWPVKESTKHSERGRTNKHTLPRWGDVPLEEITRSGMKKWVAELNRTLSSSSVRSIISTMSVALKAAVEDDLIETNPCDQLKMKELPPTPDRYLSKEECEFIREEIRGDDMRLLFDILLWTGARWGEAVALHGSTDVGAIPLKWAWSEKVGKLVNLKDHAERSVPETKHLVLPAPARNTLDSSLYDGRRPFYGPVLGRLVGYDEWRTVWDRATKELGGVRTHDLRHTYASRLASADVPLIEIQRILGHSTIQMTERYARFMPSAHARAKSALDAM